MGRFVVSNGLFHLRWLTLCSLAIVLAAEPAPAQGTAKAFRERSPSVRPARRKSEPPTPPVEASLSKADAADSKADSNAGEKAEAITEATPNKDLRPGQWQLERLELRDGTEYRGLIQARGESEYDFAEIVQPPGQPMFAVLRGIPVESVRKAERLPPNEHQKLVDRFNAFRNRAVIEAGRIDQVDLHLETRDGVTFRVYRGDWFELWSTTDDEPTRRCVVRLEQIFRAYRTILPPRTTPRGTLQVYLYGSLDEYQGRLRQLDLKLENAAFYAPAQRMIVAGSELTSFARRLAELRGRSAQAQREYVRLDREFTKGLAVLSNELKAKGFSPDEISAELAHRKANWKSEMKASLDAVAAAQRQNEAKFAEVTGQMFVRLYHEAFHAYLDHFVFPHDQHHVPRWLNEGLAQIFESGQLEGELLRIDAPSPTRLAAMQKELARAGRIPLSEMLIAADAPFLVPHAYQMAAEDDRAYLYAWGLAWYLVFERDVLSSDALLAYLSPESQKADPIQRFERLVGQPLGEFERDWRRSMERRGNAARPGGR